MLAGTGPRVPPLWTPCGPEQDEEYSCRLDTVYFLVQTQKHELLLLFLSVFVKSDEFKPIQDGRHSQHEHRSDSSFKHAELNLGWSLRVIHNMQSEPDISRHLH